MARKTAKTFLIDDCVLDKLKTLSESTLVPMSEYIRQGIDLVLEREIHRILTGNFCDYLPGTKKLVHKFKHGQRVCYCGETTVDDPQWKFNFYYNRKGEKR